MSLEEAEAAIPAVVRMFSGCEDKQTSADGTYYHDTLVGVFRLVVDPNVACGDTTPRSLCC